jgi:hypothetical protein
MLTITTPSADSTVERTFIVAGMCTPGHTVTVKVINQSTQQFYHANPQAAGGNWEATFYDVAAAVYNITAICGDMPDPIQIDNVTVE